MSDSEGEAGSVVIQGGEAQGLGGSLEFQSGAGARSTGDITIATALPSSQEGSSGRLSMASGDAAGAGSSGPISISSGSVDAGAPGGMVVSAGSSLRTSGGDVQVSSGDSAQVGDGGLLTLQGERAGDGVGGSIKLTPGEGGAKAGSVAISDSYGDDRVLMGSDGSVSLSSAKGAGISLSSAEDLLSSAQSARGQVWNSRVQVARLLRISARTE